MICGDALSCDALRRNQGRFVNLKQKFKLSWQNKATNINFEVFSTEAKTYLRKQMVLQGEGSNSIKNHYKAKFLTLSAHKSSRRNSGFLTFYFISSYFMKQAILIFQLSNKTRLGIAQSFCPFDQVSQLCQSHTIYKL